MSIARLAFASLLFVLPLAAEAALTAVQTAAICQHRSGCAIARTSEAGKPQTVVQAMALEGRLHGILHGPATLVVGRVQDHGIARVVVDHGQRMEPASVQGNMTGRPPHGPRLSLETASKTS